MSVASVIDRLGSDLDYRSPGDNDYAGFPSSGEVVKIRGSIQVKDLGDSVSGGMVVLFTSYDVVIGGSVVAWGREFTIEKQVGDHEYVLSEMR